jgi:hypothetical protein
MFLVLENKTTSAQNMASFTDSYLENPLSLVYIGAF